VAKTLYSKGHRVLTPTPAETVSTGTHAHVLSLSKRLLKIEDLDRLINKSFLADLPATWDWRNVSGRHS
jgi:hypothetical protein